jgi:hypothetical protein
MILPSQFVNDVRIGEAIRFCPNCSRVLYYGETAILGEDEAEEEGDLEEEELEEEEEEEDDEEVEEEEPGEE